MTTPHYNSPQVTARTTAGPFLRYINSIPGSKTWQGSVLFLTAAPSSTATPFSPTATTAPIGSNNYPNSTVGITSEQFVTQNGVPEKPTLEWREAEHHSRCYNANTADEHQPPPPTTTTTSPQSPTHSNTLHLDLLDTVNGWHFWRFNLSLPLKPTESKIQYTVNYNQNTYPAAFFLPGADSPMHWAYTSCNGLSLDVPEDSYVRKDPTFLWRDMLSVHEKFPLHCMVGGGDQLYNDGVWKFCPTLKAWGGLDSEPEKKKAAWTVVHESEATGYYLNNYIESFTMKDVDKAYASIPYVFVWDDHDIW